MVFTPRPHIYIYCTLSSELGGYFLGTTERMLLETRLIDMLKCDGFNIAMLTQTASQGDTDSERRRH